ncbi:hypothetical protein HOI83_02985 [Candidatus Uhrbacteria bacterium]|nr:hypothetical protein [Candidatus Uhrbacteria bacterium]
MPSKGRLKSLIESEGKTDKPFNVDDIVWFLVDHGIVLVEKSGAGKGTVYWFDALKAEEVHKIVEECGNLTLVTPEVAVKLLAAHRARFEAAKKAADEVKAAKAASAVSADKPAEADKQQNGSAPAGQEEPMEHRRLKRHSALSVDVTELHPPDWGEVVALFTRDSAETGRLGDGKTVRALIANAVSGTLTGQQKNSYMLAALNSCVVLEERDEQGVVVNHVFDHHQNEAVSMSMLLPRSAAKAAEMVIKEPTLEEIADRIAELDLEREVALGIVRSPAPQDVTQRSGLKAVPKPEEAAPAAPAPKAPAAPAPAAPKAPAEPAEDGRSFRQRMEASLRSKRDAILASSEDAVALNGRLETVRADRDTEAGRADDLSAAKRAAGEVAVAAQARVEAAERALETARGALEIATTAESSAQGEINDLSDSLERFDTVIGSLEEQIAEVALTPEQQAAVERLDTLLEPDMLTEAYGPE